MNIRYFLFFLFVFLVISGQGQDKWQKLPFEVDPVVCYASTEVRKSFIPPPPEFTNRLKSAKAGSDFIVSYIGLPDSARIAFEYAVSIWESLIFSPVPIHIQARWQVLASNVLANCGPSDYFVNFANAPFPDVYYPVALVEKLTEEQITGPGSPDMTARFNSTIPWHFGIDGKTPPGKYDFVSAVLHEIAHGLGFTGFFSVNVSRLLGYSGNQEKIPAVYDVFVENFQGQQLVNPALFPNPSEQLYRAFTSNLLYSGTYLGTKWNNNNRPRLFAPSTFNEGSSLYHLNGLTYPFGNPNTLMTHATGRGEAIHSPGPITMGILSDMGWRHLFFTFDPVKDIETIEGPLKFNATVKSDLGLDSTSFLVVYSKDGFSSNRDSVNFEYNITSDSFIASLLPPSGTGMISYYITASDTAGREFYLPAAAPEELFYIRIGADTVKPRISHTPPPFILTTLEQYTIEAVVSDNLAIDTVYAVIYKNGNEAGRIGFANVEKDKYAAGLNLAKYGFSEGGTLKYSIVAIDAASVPNIQVAPQDSLFSVAVERILSPIAGFFTDFNDGAHDFIEGDFSITRKKDFDTPALHSPNPYQSPNTDNKTFNFISMLRLPVIVKQNGIMSYDEVVLVEPGETGTVFGDSDFWDYVIVEGSKDFGQTWLPIIDGYDSRANSTWLTVYNSNISGQDSKSLGSKDLYINRQFSITANGNFKNGDTILVRFRLFSDPYANGWGWAIDNLRIQQGVSAVHQPVISPGHLTLWPNPFSDQLYWAYSGDRQVDELTFEVYDITGRVIKTFTERNVMPGMKAALKISDLPAGFCIISVKADNNSVTRVKMVKQ
jgi:hypothetical protein